jgi:hypothetical protein
MSGRKTSFQIEGGEKHGLLLPAVQSVREAPRGDQTETQVFTFDPASDLEARGFNPQPEPPAQELDFQSTALFGDGSDMTAPDAMFDDMTAF